MPRFQNDRWKSPTQDGQGDKKCIGRNHPTD